MNPGFSLYFYSITPVHFHSGLDEISPTPSISILAFKILARALSSDKAEQL